MIVLDLTCGEGHRFEGWFASVASYEDQLRLHLLACPQCGAHTIERLPAVPHLACNNADTAPDSHEQEVAQVVRELARLVAATEDVGRDFPEEARRIHYRETEVRPIRGEATVKETRELLEEGIPVLTIPMKRTH